MSRDFTKLLHVGKLLWVQEHFCGQQTKQTFSKLYSLLKELLPDLQYALSSKE